MNYVTDKQRRRRNKRQARCASCFTYCLRFNEDSRYFLYNSGKGNAMAVMRKDIAHKFEGQVLYLLIKTPAVNKRRNSYINTAA